MGLDSLNLNYYLVPAGLFVLGIYHVWLLITVLYNPSRTVIGLNSVVRTQWIFSMMTDPSENGVLMVQTLRNNIMASSLLATAAITLSSVISVFVSTSLSSESTSTQKLSSLPLSSIKYLCVLLCFLVGFICNVLATRYFAHTSFLATLPVWTDKTDYVKYVSVTLNRGSYFWSLGLRAFYLSIPMFLWIFGPIAMFVCCCLMSSALYFLDTTTSSTQLVLGSSLKEEGERTNDVESIVQSLCCSKFSGKTRAVRTLITFVAPYLLPIQLLPLNVAGQSAICFCCWLLSVSLSLLCEHCVGLKVRLYVFARQKGRES